MNKAAKKAYAIFTKEAKKTLKDRDKAIAEAEVVFSKTKAEIMATYDKRVPEVLATLKRALKECENDNSPRN